MVEGHPPPAQRLSDRSPTTPITQSLPNVETAVERVALRVQQGGHNIPANIIRRRFASGLVNFQHHYKMAVSDWALYDNTGMEPALLEWSENP